MSQHMQAERIVSRPAQPGRDDDHVVLRLAREALRQDPPRVRFVGRSVAGSDQGALPWRAFD
jgi:hypothetical protein